MPRSPRASNRDVYVVKADVRWQEAMARRGVLTRPIGNVVVLMPPLAISKQDLQRLVHAVAASIPAAEP